ncbi:unnamed protein product [Dibothriocephalus latus]|uniref:Uncharacterized protein n=1 Tax=Dibothriocephalus latus TaxID=60516 RepID=A0A3P6UTK9_DIBLA|nr:unnamed protein product [Dibothriocephalus latus]
MFTLNLDLPPVLSETIRAVKKLSSGVTPGSHAIPAYTGKYSDHKIRNQLNPLFHGIWCQIPVPRDFRDTASFHLFKWKGNHQRFDNHRRISALKIAGKILVVLF